MLPDTSTAFEKLLSPFVPKQSEQLPVQLIIVLFWASVSSIKPADADEATPIKATEKQAFLKYILIPFVNYCDTSKIYNAFIIKQKLIHFYFIINSIT